MTVVIGGFTLEAFVSLRHFGFSVFLRMPFVCEAYISRRSNEAAWTDAWKDGASYRVRIGKTEAAIDPWHEVKRCQGPRLAAA